MEIRRTLQALILASAFCLPALPAPAAALSPSDLLGPGVNHPERHWKTFETPHFVVHFYQGYADFAQTAARIAERSFDHLASDLNVAPQDKIPLIITEDEFWNGFAEPLRTRIVLDPRFALEPTIGLSRFMLHELTHILNFLAVDDGSPYGRLKHAAGLPSWFAEGLAQYEAEYWTPEVDRLLRMHVLDHTLLTPSERNAFILIGSRGADGYNEGMSIVKYLFDSYGHDKLNELLSYYRQQNMSFDQALELTFGKPILVLEAEWRDQLEARYRDEIEHRSEKLPKAEELVPYEASRTWYHPHISPNGKWLAYMSTGSYPTIRGFLYNILPLDAVKLDRFKKYGEQQKAKAEKENTDAQPSVPPDLDQQPGFHISSAFAAAPEPTAAESTPEPIATPSPSPSASDKPSDKPDEPELKLKDIQNQLVRQVLDFSWRPDSQALAYTTLTANANGNTTTRAYALELQEKDDKLEAKGDPIELTPGKTSHSVVWLPDGKTVALVVEEGNHDHIDLYDVASHTQIRRLLSAPDYRQYRALALSPDGQKLALEVFIPGQGQHLLQLALNSGETEQLTHPALRESDRHPVWSPDGQALYFVSNRTGFTDLYRLDLDSHQIERLSQVYSGIETPSFSPDGQELLHVRHHARGTSLDEVALKDLKVFDHYPETPDHNTLAKAAPLPFLPPTEPLPKLDFKPQDYIPWIAPEVVVPVVGRDEDGDQLGFLAQFSDLLQQHAFNMLVLYGIASQRFSYSAAYINHFFDTSFGLSVSDSPVLSFTTDGSQYFIQRAQELSFFASRPLFNKGSGDTSATRIERTASLEFTLSQQNNLTHELDGTIDSQQLREGLTNTLSLSFNDDRTRDRKQNFRYSLNAQGGSSLWGSQYNFLAVSGEWRHYIPTWEGQEFAYMIAGTALTGETRPALLGGPPLSNLLVLNFQNIMPLRGFSIAQLQGPLMLASNIEYRFPILKPVILSLGDHYLENLDGAFFMDIGDAWYPEQRSPFPHIGTGFELRSDVILNRRNQFKLYAGVGKALLGSGADFLRDQPFEFYGGFANNF